MDEIAYLFIDGGYLQTLYRDSFRPIFSDTYAIDYEQVKRFFSARRVYYYDCLDDVAKPGENDADFKARVQGQEELFDVIEKVEGVHVRFGWLSPGKRRQQKEVDVCLAVDMLTHAFAKNMTKAVLLAGDRDFKPVVDSVVRLGTYVQLAYDPRIGSKELARAADSEIELNLSTLCAWIKLDRYDNRADHFPSTANYNDDDCPLLRQSPPPTFLKEGGIGQEKLPLRLYDQQNTRYVSVKRGRKDFSVSWFRDESKLLAYLERMFGAIVWS
jgi:uncharacterized LabA/DUF88 family protein